MNASIVAKSAIPDSPGIAGNLEEPYSINAHREEESRELDGPPAKHPASKAEREALAKALAEYDPYSEEP